MIRLGFITDNEKYRQKNDPQHLMFNHQPPKALPKARKSFLRSSVALEGSPAKEKIANWRDLCSGMVGEEAASILAEEFPTGGNYGYGIWKSLNRLRSGVGRCGVDMVR